MGKVIKYLKHALSNPKITFLILTIVITSRILQLLFLFNTRNDMSYQIMAAQACYNGHGISLPKIYANDLSAISYQPLIQWPPGFSALFLPFYYLFNEDYLLAAIVINLLSAIALIFSGRAILKLLNTPVYLINLFSITTGFSLYYFYLKPCTDSIAVSIFIISVYLALWLAKHNKNQKEKIVLLCILLLLCAFIKYLYLPVVFIIPLFLLCKGIATKDVHLKKLGVIVGTILFIGCAIFLAYQKINYGVLGYIKVPERGWYPQNLKSAHPYIPAAFMKPESFQLLGLGPKALAILQKYFQAVHLILLIFFVAYIFKKLTKYGFKVPSSFQDLIFISLLFSIAITLLLTWLSLRVGKEFVNQGVYWTYIEEPRYYGAVHFLLQAIVFVLPTALKKNQKYLFYFLFLLMLPEMFRGVVFTVNRISHFNKEEYGWQYELRFQKLTHSIINNEKKLHQVNAVIISGSSDWMNMRSALYCSLPIFEDANMLNNLSNVNTKQPVLLFGIIRKKDMNGFISFINSKQTHLAGSDDQCVFYISYITPH